MRDAEIALSPGFRWGGTLLAGQPITWEDVYNATAITYPAAYRMPMTGETIKTILEDVADNLFNPDPYYQQGGDMVRVGGMGYTINVDAAMGRRITDMQLWRHRRADRWPARTTWWRAGARSTKARRGPADLGRGRRPISRTASSSPPQPAGRQRRARRHLTACRARLRDCRWHRAWRRAASACAPP